MNESKKVLEQNFSSIQVKAIITNPVEMEILGNIEDVATKIGYLYIVYGCLECKVEIV